MRHDDYLPFKVDRTNGHDEIIARTNNLVVGRAAFETARRRYPTERVDYRDGARIIAHRSGDAFDENEAPALVALARATNAIEPAKSLANVSGHAGKSAAMNKTETLPQRLIINRGPQYSRFHRAATGTAPGAPAFRPGVQRAKRRRRFSAMKSGASKARPFRARSNH
jgi:hypothetical protein